MLIRTARTILYIFIFFLSLNPVFANGEGEVIYYDYRGIHSVVLKEMKAFSVRVFGDNKPEGMCRIEIPDYANSRYRVMHDVRNGEIHIWVDDTHGKHDPAIRLYLDLHVWKNTDILVDTWSGSVLVEGMNGKLYTRTDSGEICLRESGGEIIASSSTSRVRLENVYGVYAVRTGTGSIEGRGMFVFGPASFLSVSGSIFLQCANMAEDLRIMAESSSGAIELYDQTAKKRLVYGSGENNVSIKTETGSIQVE